ncbi:MAG: hypothetical protein IJP41_09460 [Synergistaceae bacterium]|nr:hypothetical protein [Synergistaceae bacterium]
MNNSKKILKLYDDLSTKLENMTFSKPVETVYNPLRYAREGLEKYLRFSNGKKRIIYLGMNPGPWGMAQTGVPFGEVNAVKNFLCINDINIKSPENENNLYPVKGLDCKRSEISGKRLWGFFESVYGTAEKFFADNFVLNYCPLLFLAESDAKNRVRNFTPDKLKKDERKELYFYCDSSLRDIIKIFEPEYVIGIGNFAEQRAVEALTGINLTVRKILHPSPASPQSNKNWGEKVKIQLQELNLI